MKIWTLAELERAAILAAWQACDYDVLKAAQLLGIGKTTIYRKLRDYGVPGVTRLVIHKRFCDEATRQLAAFKTSLLETEAFYG